MREFDNLKIIAFVGLSGSGKSTATEYLTQKGYPKVHFGGIVTSALEKSGLEPNAENIAKIKEQLANTEGDDVVERHIIKQMRDLAHAGQHRIVADGPGSWQAYRALKHEFPGELSVVSLIAPRLTRHHRVSHRDEYALTERAIDLRDYDEIETLGKGGVIALADYFLDNSGDIDKLHQQIDILLQEIEF